jgi:hypothetical protein
MMVKRLNLPIILALMISMGVKMDGKEHESPVYTQYVAEIIRSFSKQVEKDFDLECIGSGGEMPHDVEEISVKFVASRRATVEEARELEVKLTEAFVQVINAHEKIKPSLRECPFPSSRAHVTISFRDSKKKRIPFSDNDVELVFQTRDRIFYQARNPDNPYLGKDIKDEPYEEALKIVRDNAAKNGSEKSKDL